MRNKTLLLLLGFATGLGAARFIRSAAGRRVAADFEPGRRSDRSDSARFNRRLIAGVAITAAALVIGGLTLWPGFASLVPPHEPRGGLLVLEEPRDADEPGAIERSMADLEITVWEAGAPGVSIAQVRMELSGIGTGDRWYLMASGDFYVPPDRGLGLYCKYGDATPDGDSLVCPAQADNPMITFEFEQPLASSFGSPDELSLTEDLDGYDSARGTLLSGQAPSPNPFGERVVEVWLPIDRSPVTTIGGDDRYALPQIGFSPVIDSSYGEPVASSCSVADLSRYSMFYLPESCSRLMSMEIGSIEVVMDRELGTGHVADASPATVSDDALRWESSRYLPSVQATVSDPYSQHFESLRAFVSALFLGSAASCVTLIVERLLFHRRNVGRQTGTREHGRD